MTLKIASVGGGMAVGYAGSMDLATEICAYIRDLLRATGQRETPESIFQKVDATYRGNESRRNVDILLVAAPQNGSPSVTKWSNRQGVVSSGRDFAHIGSLAEQGETFIKTGIDKIRRDASKDYESSFLVRMLALMQRNTISGQTMASGVGGSIFGLRVKDGDLQWQGDTVYVLYDSVPSASVGVVYTVVRNDIAMVFSSFTNTARYFAFGFPSAISHGEWWAETLKTLPEEDLERLNDWEYCVCIATSDRRITVVKRANVLRDSMSIWFQLQPSVGVEIKPRLLDFLHITGPDNGSVGMIYVAEPASS